MCIVSVGVGVGEPEKASEPSYNNIMVFIENSQLQPKAELQRRFEIKMSLETHVNSTSQIIMFWRSFI